MHVLKGIPANGACLPSLIDPTMPGIRDNFREE
jgi:hypothetical protein